MLTARKGSAPKGWNGRQEEIEEEGGRMITGVEGCSFQEERTELVNGGQRPVGGRYTGAAMLSHRLGRVMFLLARLERVGRVRLVEGSGCQFQGAVAGQPGRATACPLSSFAVTVLLWLNLL